MACIFFIPTDSNRSTQVEASAEIPPSFGRGLNPAKRAILSIILRDNQGRLAPLSLMPGSALPAPQFEGSVTLTCRLRHVQRYLTRKVPKCFTSAAHYVCSALSDSTLQSYTHSTVLKHQRLYADILVSASLCVSSIYIGYD
jgi:hypothetical protein